MNELVFDVEGNRIEYGNIVLVTQGEHEGSIGIYKGIFTNEDYNESCIVIEIDGHGEQFPIEINGECHYISKYCDINPITEKRGSVRTFTNWFDAIAYITKNKRTFSQSMYSDFVVYGYDVNESEIEIYSKVFSYNT